MFNVNDLESMLFEDKDPATAYIESSEAKKDITITTAISTIMHILVSKNIATNKEFEEIQNKYKVILENRIRKEFEDLQKKSQEE